MEKSKKERLFRVRFVDASEKKTVEIVCRKVFSSDFLGLVTMERLVFARNSSLLILPEEEAAEKRYQKTERLHIPYSAIIFVEEFDDTPGELRTLPFVREVDALSTDHEKGQNPKGFSSSGIIIPTPPQRS